MLEHYVRDEFGVIHQVDPQPMTYDEEYLGYYEGLKERTIRLGFLRMGYLVGRLGFIPESILEIGYGPGSFLDAAHAYGVARCGGSDVKPFPLPEGVPFVSLDQVRAGDLHWQVVTMFDVLEHIHDLSFLHTMNTEHLLLAVPFCLWNTLCDEQGEVAADAWFDSWRMRLPDEHVHHFCDRSLPALMEAHGFELTHQVVLEDGLRLREGESGPNIITAMFSRRKGHQP